MSCSNNTDITDRHALKAEIQRVTELEKAKVEAMRRWILLRAAVLQKENAVTDFDQTHSTTMNGVADLAQPVDKGNKLPIAVNQLEPLKYGNKDGNLTADGANTSPLDRPARSDEVPCDGLSPKDNLMGTFHRSHSTFIP